MSRTKNTVRNLAFGYFEEIIIILLSFFARRVFVDILGTQVNGLNSVITNILGTLNLVELGFGSAIIYNLYKPLAQNDTDHIKALMDYYKRTYRTIGLIIAGIGLCLMPFLPLLIKDELDFTNIYLVFGIQLMQTVSTYLFFAYKRSLFNADQKSYILSKIRSVYIIIQYAAQIGVLYFTHSYVAYLIVILLGNIGLNLVVAIYADREYPLLKDKRKVPMDPEEKKTILKNCYALFIYRINSSVQNSTSSLLLSYFVGLNIVGFYGHYMTLVTALKTIINKVFTAMTGSLGNLHAETELSGQEKNKTHEELIFRTVTMLSFLAFGIGSVGIFGAADPFIDMWIGKGQTLFRSAVLLIALELMIYGVAKATSSFRSSMGLFQQGKYRPVASMVLNLGMGLVLVRIWSVTGVLAALILAQLLTNIWYDPLVIYRFGFKTSPKKYFCRLAAFAVIEGLSLGAIALLRYLLPLETIAGFLVYGVFSVAVFTGLSVLFFHRTEEYKMVSQLIRGAMKKIRRKFRSA